MYNLSKICSMCLSNTTFLYKSNMVDRQDKIKLIDKLNFIVFEKNCALESIIRYICDDCKHLIRTGYKFKKMCQRNYKTLQEYVENKNKKNKSVDRILEDSSRRKNNDRYHKNYDRDHRKSHSASRSSSTSNRRRRDSRNETRDSRRSKIRDNTKEKDSKHGEHRKSNLIASVERNKTSEKDVKSSESSKRDKTPQRRKSVSNSEKYKDSNTKDQMTDSRKSNSDSNHRETSTVSQPEFVLKSPKENNQISDRRNSEQSLSFNKKYYGFTTTEIQSAHEYLFNIKILLKFVTLSNAVETQNITEGIKKRKQELSKKVYKNDVSKYHTLLKTNPCPSDIKNKPMNDEKNGSNQNKRKIESTYSGNKKMKESSLESNNKIEINNNINDIDDSSSSEEDFDPMTSLPSEETTREDHLGRKSYPGAHADVVQNGTQIHAYIPNAIESTEELSKIISNPTALEKKTLTVPVLPTESLRPENLGNSFQQFNKAMSEVRSLINKDRQFECQFCDRTFTRKQFLLLHYIVHCEKEGSVYKCAVCKNAFKDEASMRQHLFTHNDIQVPQCYICNKAFTRDYAVALHILASHKGIRAFRCHICDKSFARHSTLKTHLKRHSAYKDYQCKVCGRFLSTKCGLQRHMAIHTGLKPYACKLCEKAYAYRCQLTDHIVRQHYNKDIKDNKLQ